MPDSPEQKIPCPTCGKRYRWVESMAGRRVKCKQCAGFFTMPPTAPGAPAPPITAPPANPAPPKRPEPIHQLTAANELSDERPSAIDELPLVELVEPEQLTKDPEPPPPPIAPRHVIQKTSTGEGDSYELDLDDESSPPAVPRPPARPAAAAQQAHAGKCPSCGSEVKATAVICINCGYNFRTQRKIEAPAPVETVEEPREGEEAAGDDELVPVEAPPRPAPALPRTLLMGGTSAVAKALEAGEEDIKSSKLTDLYVPIALIVIGIGVGFYNNYYDDAAAGLIYASVKVGVTVVLAVPLMFMGILIASRIADIAYGPVSLAILKLVAIALGPAALADLIFMLTKFVDDSGFLGIFVWICAATALYWGLIAWLFNLDGFETFVTVAVIVIMRNVIIGFLVALVGGMFM